MLDTSQYMCDSCFELKHDPYSDRMCQCVRPYFMSYEEAVRKGYVSRGKGYASSLISMNYDGLKMIGTDKNGR